MAHREAWDLRIDEVSGLGRRRNPATGRTELLAVGDRGTAVATIPADEAGRLPRAGKHRRAADRFRVRGLPAALGGADGQSDWEGVAGDADGRIFILREAGATVLVVSPTFEYERSIQLRWDGRGEESLESLLLLADGHLLSASQGTPLRLLEFAAPGERALGLGPSAALPADQVMQLPRSSELHCVASWDISSAPARSANDLATAGDHLFVLSSASRCIVRLRLPSPGSGRLGSDRLEPDGVRHLPEELASSRDEKPEGLLVDSRLGILVGVDRRPGSRGADVHQLGHTWDDQPRRTPCDD